MKKSFFVIILIATAAAFFASTHPDGLDKTAEKLDFARKEMGHPALLSRYSIPFLPAGGVSTALAGIAGILIISCTYAGFTRLIKKQ